REEIQHNRIGTSRNRDNLFDQCERLWKVKYFLSEERINFLRSLVRNEFFSQPHRLGSFSYAANLLKNSEHAITALACDKLIFQLAGLDSAPPPHTFEPVNCDRLD